MQVVGLFIKPQAGQPVQPQATLQLQQLTGIQGDSHAQVGSPRQVLILDLPTLQAFGLKLGDLRENIVLDDGLARLRSGQGLQIGQAFIRITFRCEPCAYLDSLQAGLIKRIGKQRGWLGMVVRDGTIAIGDTATLLPAQFPPMPDDAKSRFYEFVATIPPGKVVTTKDLILALGVTSAHYRVIPSFIKRAATSLPVHRVVAIDGSLLTKHLPHQAVLLSAEGITLEADRVSSHDYWQPIHFHR
ncbi:MAG: MGMT family protein [Leptolyngbyaceae cyanobacterium bins.302]|nr:MGMT family protein [Leptolyngbyaceae cyanobacterium bins.302]